MHSGELLDDSCSSKLVVGDVRNKLCGTERRDQP
jgi:hypothetical protein